MAKKLLKKISKNEVARFVLSAGVGFLVDIIAYAQFNNKVFIKPTYTIFNTAVPNYNLSLCISFFLGVSINFLITRYMVFSESKLAPYKQLIRFISVAIIGFFANLGVIDILIQVVGMNKVPARITAALSLFFASYFVHKLFSFSLSLRHHAVRPHHQAGS
jgi:putative flippase GtrA